MKNEYNLNENIIIELSNILNQNISNNIIGSKEWITIRKNITVQLYIGLQTLIDNQLHIKNDTNFKNSLNFDRIDENYIIKQHNSHKIINNSDFLQSKSSMKAEITIGITTCKRYSHFKQIIHSLMNEIGIFPNNFIKEIIIIDDNSSLIDKIQMLTDYPQFTFIFKSDKQTTRHTNGQTNTQTIGHSTEQTNEQSVNGHANSLNILLKLVKTKYFIYLEDDWNILTQPVISKSFQNSLSSLNSLKFSFKSLNLSVFYEILLNSLSILGFNGRIDLSTADKSNLLSLNSSIQLTGVERISQVLFNEQSDRNCAVINQNCNVKLLGTGGWERFVNYKLTDINSNHTSKIEVPYSLHEFGVFNYYSNERNHEFSFWPGMSFNPGLWDLEHITSTLSLCKRDNPHELFDEFDKKFEHRFTALTLVCGLNMAYLPLQLFEHIGEISAYDLNNITRNFT